MNLRSRLRKLEQMSGFKSTKQRNDYFEYAKKIDPNISRDDLQSPDDYIQLLKNHLDPLPEKYHNEITETS